MNSHIKNFYLSDAALKHMPEGAQIREFDMWANQNSIDLELYFEPLLKQKLRYFLTGAIFVIGAVSYSIEQIEMARALLLPMLILQMLLSKSKPSTKPRSRQHSQFLSRSAMQP